MQAITTFSGVLTCEFVLEDQRLPIDDKRIVSMGA